MSDIYPLTISTPPAHVCGTKVLAWAETARMSGSYPGGIVLAGPWRGSEYAVWRVHTRDGGITWDAGDGFYTTDKDEAWENFVSRAQIRLAEGS